MAKKVPLLPVSGTDERGELSAPTTAFKPAKTLWLENGVSFGDARLPPRFWSKVRVGTIPAHRPDLGPCWEWTAAKREGYGLFHVGSRTDGSCRLGDTHRLAYEALVGPIPVGLESDHLCRNRACVRPEHIEPVTHAENGRRSPLMGRSRGEANGRAKLREADIPIIRALRGQIGQRVLAKRFGVGQSAIGRIQRGKDWAPEPAEAK